MTMTTFRHLPSVLASLALIGSALTLPSEIAPAQTRTPQETIERLRRDQNEILRKAERLQALMTRLKQRYEREGKQEQVQQLDEGLAHLSRSGILRDVASIREDLEATAFTEALRKQREVVNDLERLLNILLARKSIENIDEQLEQVERQTRTARELEQRQRELIDATSGALQRELTPEEQELADRLAKLRDAERREAEANSRQAGARRPFLESALEQVKALLQQQARLEAGLEDEAAGRTPEARARAFDLGDLTQQVRGLQERMRSQQKQRDLGEAGKQLQTAADNGDQQALQQARDQLETLLENPPQLPGPMGPIRDPEWAKVRDRARQTPDTDTQAGREQLGEIGKSTAELAQSRDETFGKMNAAGSEQLQQKAEQLANKMAASAPSDPAGERAIDAVQTAAEHLSKANQAVKAGDTETANSEVNNALSALDQARSRHESENPDAARQAGQMAADAQAAARELQNTPAPEATEQTATEALERAASALREVEREVETARDNGEPASAEQAAGASRQELEQARDALAEALSSAAAGNRAELNGAAERQQELAATAAQVQQALEQAGQTGQISEGQQQGTQSQLEQAQQHMQNAAERLQQGQQASAAAEQRAAAQALQQAMESLQQGGDLNDEQRERLAQQAEAQQQLTEDIIRLAEELEERENKVAERAVQQAAEASRKAQRAMREGDADEAQQQQEQAREKLEEAVEELEEEQDRYMDLRQEELLFRMKEELTNFLEQQRPITEQTLEYQQTAANGRLSRPARRRVNRLGEEEHTLAGKIELLVNALTDEGNLVYQAVLTANLEDLREVGRRLAGRSPDVGTFTTLLQQDIERRTEQLLEALEREQQRREQERQQGQQQGENRFNPQREKLISLIAELEMLKQLELDTQQATGDLRALVEARGDDTISEAEVAMIQRLAHRHSEITKLFQQIKAGVEAAMQQMSGEEPQEEENKGR